MKSILLLAVAIAAGCSVEPMSDDQVNEIAQACIRAGGAPQVRYARQGQYGPNYAYPLEVRCIGIGGKP